MVKTRHTRLAQELLDEIYSNQRRSNNDNDTKKDANAATSNSNATANDLFGPPPPKQRIQITRTLGTNQSGGSRILQPMQQSQPQHYYQQQKSKPKSTLYASSISTPSHNNQPSSSTSATLTPASEQPCKSRKVSFFNPSNLHLGCFCLGH